MNFPDDVMATAREIAMNWAIPETEEPCMEAIAKAIMADRERLAPMEDVMETAGEVCSQIAEHGQPAQEAVARAILAERERAEKMLRGIGEFLMQRNKSSRTADLLLAIADAVRGSDVE